MAAGANTPPPRARQPASVRIRLDDCTVLVIAFIIFDSACCELEAKTPSWTPTIQAAFFRKEQQKCCRITANKEARGAPTPAGITEFCSRRGHSPPPHLEPIRKGV